MVAHSSEPRIQWEEDQELDARKGMMAHNFNLSTREAEKQREAGGSFLILSQLGLHSEFKVSQSYTVRS